jgi:hypothetical protein
VQTLDDVWVLINGRKTRAVYIELDERKNTVGVSIPFLLPIAHSRTVPEHCPEGPPRLGA